MGQWDNGTKGQRDKGTMGEQHNVRKMGWEFMEPLCQPSTVDAYVFM